MTTIRCLLFATLATACARPKPVVYEPMANEQGGSGDTGSTEPSGDTGGQAGSGETAPVTAPAIAAADKNWKELKIPTIANGVVVAHGTLVWSDLAGELWLMPADGSVPPKKLTNQHKDGLVFHPFHAGDHVMAKVGKELVSVSVPDGAVTRVHVKGAPDLVEELTSDGANVFMTVFRHNDVLRVPASGGTAAKVVSVARGLLSLHASTLYVTSYVTGELMAIPVGGGAPRTIAKGLKKPTAIAVDDAAAYVYIEDDQKVLRVELATGATSVLGDHLNNSDELAVADDEIYTVSWPGKLVRLAKRPGTPVVTLAEGLHQPRGVAFDEHYVYVMSEEPPRLVRVPRK